MIELPWVALQTADDALMARQYMPRRRRSGPLLVSWHPTLLEPEWNRIRIVRKGPRLETQLKDALSDLEAFGGGCVTLDPNTPQDTLGTLRRLDCRPIFEHTWVLYDLDSGSVADGSLPEELSIEDLGPADGTLFRNLFHTGFATYQHGPESLTAWDTALLDILRQETQQASREHGSTYLAHCLARWRGEPAGIASYGVRGEVAGLYNLAVHPHFRRRGIGGHLTRYRHRRARGLGARIGFLQTQDDSVLRWHLRRGAHQGPVIEGWSPISQAA